MNSACIQQPSAISIGSGHFYICYVCNSYLKFQKCIFISSHRMQSKYIKMQTACSQYLRGTSKWMKSIPLIEGKKTWNNHLWHHDHLAMFFKKLGVNLSNVFRNSEMIFTQLCMKIYKIKFLLAIYRSYIYFPPRN